MIRQLAVTALLCLGLTACGEPAPQGWNANIDVNCQPQDPADKLYAMFSPKKFWREQEYDMGTLKKAGEKNLSLSQQVLDDSRAQKGDFLRRAEEKAREQGLTGNKRRDFVRDGLARYDQEVKDMVDRIKYQEQALRWISKCEQTVNNELRKRGLLPVPFDSEKRPM